MRVQVYRNLHKSIGKSAVYSVRDKKTRRVVDHQSFIILRDCKFHVSQSGRERVLREKRKNVHAWVEGSLLFTGDDALSFYEKLVLGAVEATLEGVLYNPYRYDQFQRATGGPAPEGCSVVFTPHSVSIINTESLYV